MAHWSLDSILDSAGFLMAEGKDYDLLGAEDGSDTDCHGLGRNLVEVIVEETGIDNSCIVGKGNDAGTGLKRRERLVESDMAVFAYSSEEEVEAAGLDDSFLICLAFCDRICSITVKNMDILRLLVDLVEKVLVHERVVALRMAFRKTNILIHVE